MGMADAARQQGFGVFGAPTNSWFTKAREVITVWRKRARDRYALGRLNDHYLRDIGMTRHEVMAECAKPFWLT